jgi:hypothetical protein
MKVIMDSNDLAQRLPVYEANRPHVSGSNAGHIVLTLCRTRLLSTRCLPSHRDHTLVRRSRRGRLWAKRAMTLKPTGRLLAPAASAQPFHTGQRAKRGSSSSQRRSTADGLASNRSRETQAFQAHCFTLRELRLICCSCPELHPHQIHPHDPSLAER